MAAGIRWGKGGDGQKAEGDGEGEREAEATGGGSGVGHFNSQGGSHGKIVGPASKREAVSHVEEVLEVSERRACGVTEQPRATQRYRGKQRSTDAGLVGELRRISAE